MNDHGDFLCTFSILEEKLKSFLQLCVVVVVVVVVVVLFSVFIHIISDINGILNLKANSFFQFLQHSVFDSVFANI